MTVLSIENIAAVVMAEYRFSASGLAALDGNVSAAMLSKYLQGHIPIPSEKEKSLRDTIAAVRSLAAEFPVPIDFNQVPRIKPLLDARKKQLHDDLDPVIRRCTLIQISKTTFFLTMRQGEIVTTPSENLAAAFESPLMAGEVIRQLAILGTKAWPIEFNALRRKSSLSNSLIEVGFEPETPHENE